MVAEAEGRRWLAFELNREYVAASVLRFVPKGLTLARTKALYSAILGGESVSIEEETGFQPQLLAV
jgi:site-specific DNA-methyltransferase (cytosine-N4-specific)